MRNPFGLVKHLFANNDEHRSSSGRRTARIISGTFTEFIFCNRKFGAVIIDASHTGMKLSCDIRLGIGTIITLIDPAMTAKIVWRDDGKNLMGVEFIRHKDVAVHAATCES